MSEKPRIYSFNSLNKLCQRIRSDLKDIEFVLLFAYNQTGKTRLSMEFKDAGKRKKEKEQISKDTLSFDF